MTNNIKKLVVTGLACVALAGTTFAAPHSGHGDRHAPVAVPTCHRIPGPHPAPPPPAPHHHGGNHGEWIMAGAAAVGGFIGGIIGACR